MKTTKFKPSEVGPIPEEWEVKPFSECFTLMRNNTYSRDCLTDLPGTVANVHYGDVLIRYGAVLDFEKDSVPYLKSGVKPNKDLLKDGDLIFADTAEDETAGKAVEVQGVRPRMAVAGLHTVACRPQGEIFAPRYLGYYINSAAYHNQLLPLMTGTKVTSVSRAGFASTYVAIPPKSEQEKIAEALSDVDALLAAMTKLIEKKRAIKQGAMQQLLTGKKRLAGFTGKWVEKRLGECSTMFAGGTPSSNVDGYYGGAIPWVSISDISIAGKYIEATSETLTEEGLNNSSAKWYPQNTLLFAMYASIGKCCIARKRMTSSQAILGIYNFRDVDMEFLYYLLTFRNGEFLTMGQTGTQANLSKSIVEDVIIDAPTLAEQQAIAAVLSDMDAEIAALESKRAKYESVKQSMMQELLTGKARLV